MTNPPTLTLSGGMRHSLSKGMHYAAMIWNVMTNRVSSKGDNEDKANA